MLDPAQIDTDGDRYLHYSVSSDNVVTDEDQDVTVLSFIPKTIKPL